MPRFQIRELARVSRMLIIPGYKLYPLFSGSSIAQLGMLNELSSYLEIHLIVKPENVAKDDIVDFQKEYPDVKLHYFEEGNKVENQKLKLGFQQIRKWIKMLVSSLRKTKTSDFKEEFNFKIANPKMEFVEFLNGIFNKLDFDIVQVDLFSNLPLAPFLPKSMAKIYVCHECRFGRLQTQIEAHNMQLRKYYTDYVKYCEVIETAFFNFFDFVLVFSKEDKKRIASSTKAKVKVSPFAMPCNLSVRSEKKITKLVFVGSDNHFPNKDGVLWIIKDLISEFKEAKVPLYIVGEWAEKSKKEFVDAPGVYFTGFVENLDDFLLDAILLAPIRIGGGVKSKVLYGLSRGMPVISTTFGAEGIPVTPGENILIADTPVSFVEAINEILGSPDLLAKLRNKSQELISMEFDAGKLAHVRMSFINECIRKHSL